MPVKQSDHSQSTKILPKQEMQDIYQASPEFASFGSQKRSLAAPMNQPVSRASMPMVSQSFQEFNPGQMAYEMDYK